MDKDPHEAIAKARALTVNDAFSQDMVDGITSGILIDAGHLAHDMTAVDDGIAILERIYAESPMRGDVIYCLANGLSNKAYLTERKGFQWYLDTSNDRRRARQLFQTAATLKSTHDRIKAEAYTNLGNSLLDSYRSVEAYDCYTRALMHDPTNGIALTGAAKILINLSDSGIGDSQQLRSIAAKYLQLASEDPEGIRELAGERAYVMLTQLLELDLPTCDPPDLSNANPYQRFVARHNLALSPTIEGLDLDIQRWDSLTIHSITEPANTESGVPPLFAMFNTLKSDYLTARYLTHIAINEKLPESGNYHDTLDYASYGIQTSILTMAQRACVDILDKVAVATSEYLNLPVDPKKIYFTNTWFEKTQAGQPLKWKQEIHNAIKLGNTALIAIAEVSGDIRDGGFLQEKRTIRNSATHRFAVLHDMGTTGSRESRFVDHFKSDLFVSQLIETLQLTRAVLIYFCEMIQLHEHFKDNNGGLKIQMHVPDHDWVRGRK